MTTDAGAATQDQGQQDQTQTGGGNAGAGAQQATFTQADLDRIVSERLERERSKYRDYPDLKAKATEYEKLAEAQKTQAQKDAELLEQTKRERAVLEQERKEFSVRREINKVANDPRGVPLADEDAAYRLIDPTDIQFGADNRPTNIPELLKQLVKDRPFLAGSKKPGSVDGGQGGGQAPALTLDDRIRSMAGYG